MITTIPSSKGLCKKTIWILAWMIAFAGLPASAEDLVKSKEFTDKGKLMFDQGDLKGAADAYSKAIEENPRNASAYHLRGVLRARQGDADGSIEDYTKAIEIDGTNPLTWTDRAYSKIRKKDYQGAVDDATKAIDLDPENSHGYLARASAYKSLGDSAKADADNKKARELKGGFASIPIRKNTYGVEGDLKGLSKIFVDIGGQEAALRKVMVDYIAEKLPTLTILNSLDQVDSSTVVINFHGLTFQNQNVGEVYILTPEERRMITSFRYRGRGLSTMVKDFAKDFVKVYKKINSLK